MFAKARWSQPKKLQELNMLDANHISETRLRELLHLAARSDDSTRDEAIGELWRYYYPRLKLVVGSRIASIPRLVDEDSDLTSEALQDFICHKIRSPLLELSDVNKVWNLIKVVTLRHINDVAKHRFAQKRGGQVTTVSYDVATDSGWESSSDGQLGTVNLTQQIVDNKGTDPIDDLLFSEMLEALLQALPDETAQRIVLLRLENRSTGEIADLLKVSIRTIQRQIREIEQMWGRLQCQQGQKN
ncbi:MAG: HTH domain-containing protein [Pirellulaceae bacterium]|nr:HTH domain-containing protein [Pirellulaceae bacterium]